MPPVPSRGSVRVRAATVGASRLPVSLLSRRRAVRSVRRFGRSGAHRAREPRGAAGRPATPASRVALALDATSPAPAARRRPAAVWSSLEPCRTRLESLPLRALTRRGGALAPSPELGPRCAGAGAGAGPPRGGVLVLAAATARGGLTAHPDNKPGTSSPTRSALPPPVSPFGG